MPDSDRRSQPAQAALGAAPGGTGVASPPAAPAPYRLPDAARRELEELATRYPNREALLLPALWLVQGDAGWISLEAMEHVAEVLGVSPIRVQSVVTFYHMFHDRPPGTYTIQVCHNISCSLRGAEKLLARLHEKLGVGENEPTPDGRFMIQRVECLGACEHAPACQVNERFHFDLTPEKLDRILAEPDAEGDRTR